jgi:putative mRNA 3-end processing factor
MPEMTGHIATLPEVIYDRGVHLLGSVLWMDASRAREMCFVSHSGVPGIRHHTKILCTDRTARLGTRLRRGGRRLNALVCPYNRPFSLGPLRMELLPSGYALGSAQLYVETAGFTVLYTGDLCLRSCAGVEPAQARAADVLVIDASVAKPGLSLPPHREIEARLVDFVGTSLADGFTPVLLCEPVGTAQQVSPLLVAAGHQVAAHPSIASAHAIHEEFGVRQGPYRVSRGTIHDREVLLWPSHLRRSPSVRAVPRARFAALVNNPTAAPDQVGADVVFPWIRHATWPDIAKFVDKVKPKRVYAFKGWERELAAALRKQGFDARELSSGLQLPLFG